jgi:hypothetical protein
VVPTSVSSIEMTSSSIPSAVKEGQMRRRFSFALTMVLAVGVACGGDEGTIQIGGQRANDHGAEEVSGETSVEFELDDFYLEPTRCSEGSGPRSGLALSRSALEGGSRRRAPPV